MPAAKPIDVVVAHPNLYYQGKQQPMGSTIAMDAETLRRTGYLDSGAVELKESWEARKEAEKIMADARVKADKLMAEARGRVLGEAESVPAAPEPKQGGEKKN